MNAREKRALRVAITHALAIELTSNDSRARVSRTLRGSRTIVREALRDRLADRELALDGETDPRARALAIVATLDHATHERIVRDSIPVPVPYGRRTLRVVRGGRS